MAGASLHVTVAWASTAGVHLLAVEVPDGASLRDAVVASGLLALEPQLAAESLSLGVFGRLQPPDRRARDGDRIEVYRPLTVDPKEARRIRADVRRRRGATSRSG